MLCLEVERYRDERPDLPLRGLAALRYQMRVGVKAGNECTCKPLESVLACMWACPVEDKVIHAQGELLTWCQPQCTCLIHHGNWGKSLRPLLFHHFTPPCYRITESSIRCNVALFLLTAKIMPMTIYVNGHPENLHIWIYNGKRNEY